MLQLIRNLFGGFLMGSADLVPGVSGGTVALVIGIYERLIDSIRSGSSALGRLIRGDVAAFRTHLLEVEWRLLLPLLLGIGTAIVSLSAALEHQLEARPTLMAGFFFGLVIGSVVIAWRMIEQPGIPHWVVALLVGVGLFLFLGAGQADSGGSEPSLLAFAASGAVAICAMILPGISGSLILLLLGMYTAVLGAVNDRDFVVIGLFALGAVGGLAVFSQGLHWALRNHRPIVLAGLVGLMAGSLRVLWPWPGGVEEAVIEAPAGDWPTVLLWGAVGFVLVFLISKLSTESEISEQLPDHAQG